MSKIITTIKPVRIEKIKSEHDLIQNEFIKNKYKHLLNAYLN